MRAKLALVCAQTILSVAAPVLLTLHPDVAAGAAALE